MKTGFVRYDDKHDSYFIQDVRGEVFTLWTFDIDENSFHYGQEVKFEANEFGEVQQFEVVQ